MLEDIIDALEEKFTRHPALFLCSLCQGITRFWIWHEQVREARAAARDLVGNYCTNFGIDVPGLTPFARDSEGDRSPWFEKFVKGEPWASDCFSHLVNCIRICGMFSDTTWYLIVNLCFVAAYLRELGITHNWSKFV